VQDLPANETEETKKKMTREIELVKNGFLVAIRTWQLVCPTSTSTSLQFPADIRPNDRTPLRQFARSFIRNQALPIDKMNFTEQVQKQAIKEMLALEWPVEYARTESVARVRACVIIFGPSITSFRPSC